MAVNDQIIIVFASDHGGINLRESLARECSRRGYEIFDASSDQKGSVDYPDVVSSALKTFHEKKAHFLVLVCGSGVGVSIAANRDPLIRAVCTDSVTVARLAREHNHANCLCLGERLTGPDLAREVLQEFLGTSVDSDERHRRRVSKLGLTE